MSYTVNGHDVEAHLSGIALLLAEADDHQMRTIEHLSVALVHKREARRLLQMVATRVMEIRTYTHEQRKEI